MAEGWIRWSSRGETASGIAPTVRRGAFCMVPQAAGGWVHTPAVSAPRRSPPSIPRSHLARPRRLTSPMRRTACGACADIQRPAEVFPVILAPLLTGPRAVDARALHALQAFVGGLVERCEQDRPDPTQELAECCSLNKLVGLVAGELGVVELSALSRRPPIVPCQRLPAGGELWSPSCASCGRRKLAWRRGRSSRSSREASRGGGGPAVAEADCGHLGRGPAQRGARLVHMELVHGALVAVLGLV